MKSSSLTMVFVVHAGELEIKSAVLAASLRKRFGFSMDIIAACPSGKADWVCQAMHPGAYMSVWAFLFCLWIVLSGQSIQ